MLEEIPFEEWEWFVRHAMVHYPAEAQMFLESIALNHFDDGWRFNAARILIEGGRMDDTLRSRLAEREAADADFMERLEPIG